jgi:hypothetical protein
VLVIGTGHKPETQPVGQARCNGPQ